MSINCVIIEVNLIAYRDENATVIDWVPIIRVHQVLAHTRRYENLAKQRRNQVEVTHTRFFEQLKYG